MNNLLNMITNIDNVIHNKNFVMELINKNIGVDDIQLNPIIPHITEGLCKLKANVILYRFLWGEHNDNLDISLKEYGSNISTKIRGHTKEISTYKQGWFSTSLHASLRYMVISSLPPISVKIEPHVDKLIVNHVGGDFVLMDIDGIVQSIPDDDIINKYNSFGVQNVQNKHSKNACFKVWCWLENRRKQLVKWNDSIMSGSIVDEPIGSDDIYSDYFEEAEILHENFARKFINFEHDDYFLAALIQNLYPNIEGWVHKGDSCQIFLSDYTKFGNIEKVYFIEKVKELSTNNEIDIMTVTRPNSLRHSMPTISFNGTNFANQYSITLKNNIDQLLFNDDLTKSHLCNSI